MKPISKSFLSGKNDDPVIYDIQKLHSNALFDTPHKKAWPCFEHHIAAVRSSDEIFLCLFSRTESIHPPIREWADVGEEDLTTRDFYFRTLRLVDRIEDQKLAFCCVESFFLLFFHGWNEQGTCN